MTDYSKLRKKLTHLDFSKHELKIKENELVSIHILQIGNCSTHKFVFTNCEGVLTVSGDYGNWVFCRRFDPSPEGYVSPEYWCEKLRISSVQESHEWDSDEVAKRIDELLIDEDHEWNDEEKEFLNEMRVCENEFEYIAKYYNSPNNFDSEYIPTGKIMKYRLNYIFDAFNEICSRLESNAIVVGDV